MTRDRGGCSGCAPSLRPTAARLYYACRTPQEWTRVTGEDDGLRVIDESEVMKLLAERDAARQVSTTMCQVLPTNCSRCWISRLVAGTRL